MTGLRMRALRLDDDEDARAWMRLTSQVFQMERPDETELAWRRERSAGQRVSVVEDDGDLVAAFRSYGTTLSLPGGGLVPADAVSGVVVQSTHKRRGLLTRWLTEDLRAAKQRGDVAAALFASEAGIYGRYGFGIATGSARWRIEAREARLLRPPEGRMRVVEADVVRPLAAALYQAAQAYSVGSIARSPSHWAAALGVSDLAPGSRKRWHAIHLPDASGVPDGLVTYVPDFEWSAGRHRSRVRVEDLIATGDDAEAALLQYVCGIDFVSQVELSRAPGWAVGDLLANPRAAQVDEVVDGLWVRLLDVPAALTARRYATDGELVVEVADPLGLAAGRWLLAVRDGVASCEPATGEPDLAVGVAGLSSLWLGGDAGVPSIGGLARSGRAQVRTGSLERVSAMFATAAAPFCLTHF